MYHIQQKESCESVLSAIPATCAAAALLICGGCGSSSSSGGSASVPSPVASYVAGNDPLRSYFSTIQNFQDQDSFTFSETNSMLYVPDPDSFGQGAVTTAFTTKLFDSGFDEAADIVFNHNVHLSQTTIMLPKSGTIQVTQETEYEPNATSPDTYPDGYSYFTISPDGLTKTMYGFDGIWEGSKITSQRFDPGIVIPLSLAAGLSFAETYTEYDTFYGYDINEVESVSSYDVTATFSLRILPSLTVPAGTFTNVAEMQLLESYTLPLGYNGSLTSNPVVDTEIFDLSESTGIIQLKTTSVTQDVLVTLNPAYADVSRTLTSNYLEQLTSATIAGKKYGKDKSARDSNGFVSSRDGPQVR